VNNTFCDRSICCCVYSDEGSREKEHCAGELHEADRRCKLPRISDVDLFASDVAEQRRMSADAADDCVHSSGEVEIVPPSPLQCSVLPAAQNTNVLKGTRTRLRHAASQKWQSPESCADMEMSDDVEPDGLSVSSSTECLHCEQISGRDVMEADASPVINTGRLSGSKYDQLIIDEKQKPLAESHSLSGLLNGAHMEDQRGVSAVSELDDIVCVNASDSEVVDGLATQLPAAGQSVHSCSTVDVDSSQVNMQLILYLSRSTLYIKEN